MKKNFLTVLICLVTLALNAQVATLLKDINPNGSSSAEHFKSLNSNTVVFTAYDGQFYGLWKTNGTTAGTKLVRYAKPKFNFTLSNSLVYKGKLYFAVDLSGDGSKFELGVSDGTFAGTKLFMDLNPNGSGSYPGDFELCGGKLVFNANGHVYVSDGTENGTAQISETIIPNNKQMCSGDYIYYFKNKFGVFNKHELWRMNVITGQATIILPGDFSASDYIDFISINNEMYVSHWITDTNNTYLSATVKKITESGAVVPIMNAPHINNTSIPVVHYGNKNYYIHNDTVAGVELFSEDLATGLFSLEVDVVPGILPSYPQYLTVLNENIYFTAENNMGGSPGRVCYKLEGGVLSQVQLDSLGGYVGQVVSVLDKIYITGSYAGGNYLYQLDSNASEAQLIFIDNFSTVASEFIVCGDLLLFKGFIGGDEDNSEPFVLDPLLGGPKRKWTGNLSTNWYTADNWRPQQVPTDTNDVIIPAGCTRYPLITTGVAKCKALDIQSEALLSMTGGMLNVYGKFDYLVPSSLNLTGGTVKLYGGTQTGFWSGTVFNNLTLTSNTNDPADNDYAIEGSVTIAGNLVMSGTTAGNNPEFPYLFMLNSSKLFLKGNITVNQGHLGTTNDLLPLPDNNLLPEVVLSGNAANTQQQLRFKNKVTAFSNRSGIIANMVVLYNNVKLFNTGNSVQVLNLEVAEDFNLYGNTFITAGKIIYNPNFTGKIKNTGSYNTGKLWIQNDVRYSPDLLKAELRCDKYGSYLGFVEDVGGTKANDTLVLLSDLTTDIIEWNGYIDMNGKNVTLGATTRSTGYLAGGELGSSIATGTLKLIGNSSCPQYGLFAKKLNHLTINNLAGVKLLNDEQDQSDLEVYGIIQHTLGNFNRNGTTVKLAAHPLANGVNVAKLIEGDTSICYDSELGRIYIDTTYTTPLSNVNTGGLGFFITTPETWLNQISINRYNASNLDDIIGSNMVGRIFLISNKNAGGNLNAQLKIKYAEYELNGVPESELRLYRYNSNLTNPYQLIPSTVDTVTNIVSATSNLFEIDLYDSSQPGTYYFLASPNTPPARMTAPVAAMATNNPLLINAYPNPFSNSVTIAFNSPTAENAQLFVTDVTGRIYYNSSQIITEGENKIPLTCLEIAPAGIYLVTIKNAAGNNTLRIVKQP